MMIFYLLQFFPKLSEAFILDELCELERQGTPFAILALRPWPEKRVHPAAGRLLDRVTYLEEQNHSRTTKLLALARLAARAPSRLAGAYDLFVRQMGERYRWIYSQSIPTAFQLLREGGTHLHAHFAGPALDHAFVLSRLTGIPFSFTAHGSDLHVRPHPLLGMIGNESAAVFTPTRFNRSVLTGRYGIPERRIHLDVTGIDTDRFRPGDEREPGSVLTVARLHPIKGLRYLIEAYAILRVKNVPFRATIVGEGPERENLERSIRENNLGDHVRLAGEQTRDQILEELRKTAIFALPSLSEGMPTSLMEAMSCGVPVVATSITGVPELVEEGRAGLLVPPENPEALAERIERLLSDPALGRKMGEEGRKRIESDFPLTHVTRRRVEIMHTHE